MADTRTKSVFTMVVLLLMVLMGTMGCSRHDSDSGNAATTPEETASPYDIVIKNGRVIDPETGRDEIATVGIKAGVIKTISAGSGVDVPHADQCIVIDAAGLIVSPGFINTHTHEGNGIAGNQYIESSKAYVQDGITFWLGGNCGLSATGVRIKFNDIWIDTRTGQTLPQYLDDAARGGLYTNYGTLSGNITLRGEAGLEHGQAETAEQIAEMVEMLKQDLAAGAFGVSFGPFYDPGTTKEAMTALSQASHAAGGMAAIHTRNPMFNLWNVLNPNTSPSGSSGLDIILFKESLTEAIDVCRASGAPFIISHLTDMAYNGSTKWSLDTIESAITKEKLPMAADVIGYDTFMNDLFALTRFGQIPVRVLILFAGAKPDQFWMGEDVYIDGILYMQAYEHFKDIGQIETLVQAFKDGKASAGQDSEALSVNIWCNIVEPENTKLALTRPFVFMGNDGGVSKNKKTGELTVQPRSYACFSRLLGHWSRDEKAITLKQSLFKATIAPALWLGLEMKGRLQEGYDADITIFNPNTIIDRAKPEPGKLNIPPVGIAYVIVNGEIVVEQGALTGKTPGKLIRRTWQIWGETQKVIALYQQRFPS